MIRYFRVVKDTHQECAWAYPASGLVFPGAKSFVLSRWPNLFHSRPHKVVRGRKLSFRARTSSSGGLAGEREPGFRVPLATTVVRISGGVEAPK